MDKYKQQEDVTKAISEYNKGNQTTKSQGDLSVKGAASKMVERRNILDKLDEDLSNAGKTDYEKQIWEKD